MTETRIVTAPVLIPDSPDCEYNLGENTLTPEEIKQFKDSFDKYQIFDLNHDYENKIRQGIMPENRGELLDSYILTKPTKYTNINNETQTLPKGSWLVKSRITDPEAIKLYDKGKIRAYSATVVQELKGTIMNLIKNSSTKSLNIAPTYKQDLRKNIIDPVLYTISYVDQPCQPETVFCKLCDINNNNYNDTEDNNLDNSLDNTSTKSTRKDKVEVYQMTEDKENKINNIFQNAREEVNNLFTKANVKEDKEEDKDKEVKTESKKEDKDKDKLEYITKNELTKILDDKMKTVSETISTKLTENLTNQLTEQKASTKANYLTKEEVNTVIEDNFSKFADSVIERVTLNNKASIKSYKDKLSKDIKGTNEKVPDVKEDDPVLGKFEGRDAFGNRIN